MSSEVETSLDVFGGFLLLRRFRHRPNPNPSQIFIRLQQVRPSTFDDLEQIIHRRNFFQLFGQEPLQEIDRDIIVLLSRELHQAVDLLGHVNLDRKSTRLNSSH